MLMFVKTSMGYCRTPACSICAVAATLNTRCVVSYVRACARLRRFDSNLGVVLWHYMLVQQVVTAALVDTIALRMCVYIIRDICTTQRNPIKT